ncbi:type II pantothenate kinase [Virgibacillus doumboii]|uniref:type II pantothenate kinase n=1 Tax=Virgibacillus doumboii TaxID=2697503 RepID=UPI0013E0501D|nr:type II pantothenate kinase [Virgibacillus doumboii]
MNQTKIGIDAGGTLIKVASQENGAINYQSFPSRDIDEVCTWFTNSFDNPAVCITGGKSKVLAEKLNIPAKTVIEFDATTKGIQFLADQQKHDLGDSFLFVNVGTGTSIHHVNGGKQERVGGSGVGGGTLLGLAYLSTGIRNFEEIVQHAGNGDRENVDLKVKDIFEGTLPPISGDLTASNFGKTEAMLENSPEKADILASIIGLIGEVIVTISIQMAEQYNTEKIVYIGSSFRSNPLLQKLIEEYTRMIGKTPVFLQKGEYSGAVGALLSID